MWSLFKQPKPEFDNISPHLEDFNTHTTPIVSGPDFTFRSKVYPIQPAQYDWAYDFVDPHKIGAVHSHENPFSFMGLDNKKIVLDNPVAYEHDLIGTTDADWLRSHLNDNPSGSGSPPPSSPFPPAGPPSGGSGGGGGDGDGGSGGGGKGSGREIPHDRESGLRHILDNMSTKDTSTPMDQVTTAASKPAASKPRKAKAVTVQPMVPPSVVETKEPESTESESKVEKPKSPKKGKKGYLESSNDDDADAGQKGKKGKAAAKETHVEEKEDNEVEVVPSPRKPKQKVVDLTSSDDENEDKNKKPKMSAAERERNKRLMEQLQTITSSKKADTKPEPPPSLEAEVDALVQNLENDEVTKDGNRATILRLLKHTRKDIKLGLARRIQPTLPQSNLGPQDRQLFEINLHANVSEGILNRIIALRYSVN